MEPGFPVWLAALYLLGVPVVAVLLFIDLWGIDARWRRSLGRPVSWLDAALGGFASLGAGLAWPYIVVAAPFALLIDRALERKKPTPSDKQV